MYTRIVHIVMAATYVLVSAASAAAQDEVPAHQHAQMGMSACGWQFMQDGVLFGVFNKQGGPRGVDEFKAPNWWMGMLTRKVGSSQLTFNTMLSLDPLTAGKDGYAEIFQVGEALDGRPLIDRQHPHDLFMQLAAIWRWPLTSETGFTLAGGPAGEPALGPVAFMHRASAAEYPFATLSHHTFDSTHIAYGVVTAAVDHGRWVVEGSLFNGREPDENRWDFDFGPLDSVSGRVWYRPTTEWEFQASTGHLKNPEELHPGNVQRTTASASWTKVSGTDFSGVTIGYGVNVTDDASRHAVFGEGTRHVGPNSMFLRMELVQVETDLLLNDAVPETHDSAARKDPVGAVTLGGVRDIVRWRGFEGGLGAAVSFYAVPDALRPTHGTHPVSFQVFFRLRPPASAMGRMWNMRMSQPMAGHSMAMDHQTR
jgi:hypothetical protein